MSASEDQLIEDMHAAELIETKTKAKSACFFIATRYDAIAAKAQKDSYARDRAESMARACRECAQEVGR